MKKLILIALLAVAVAATPAFASVQNMKVSGDIKTTFVDRDQFDLGVTTDDDVHQNFLLTQTRVRFDADLTENVSATVGLLNERVWGQSDTGADADVDLNLAFVELREMLYSPLTVVIGRHNFAYGNSLIIDSTGTNNTISTSSSLSSAAADLTMRSSQDAIRLIFDYNPLSIEVLAAKLSSGVLTGTSTTGDDDSDLYGAHGTYKLDDDWDSTASAYFWARIDSSTTVANNGGKSDTLYIPGFHVSTNPIKGLNTQVELAYQLGNKATTESAGSLRPDNVSRHAMAAQVVTNYLLPFEETAEYNPVLTTVYTYTSGDNGPNESGVGTTNDNYTAWDPVLENQGGGTIYNTLFDLTNSHIVTSSLTANPMEDVTAKVTGTWIWLDKAVDVGDSTGDCTGGANCLVIRQPDSATLLTPKTTNDKGIGYEVDFDFLYDYTEDVQFGYSMGWFFPGDVFHSDNSETAKQFLVHGNVNF